MKKIIATLILGLIAFSALAQDFSKPTNTETLKEQTMIFKLDLTEDQSSSLALWGQGTGLGAAMEFVDMANSPRPKEIEMTYAIVSHNSLYLLYKGEKFQFVILRNDTAYIYSADDEELLVKLPRVI